MADKAYITPQVLKWARESARMTEETAASKIPSLTVDKLKEWEDGLSQPTIRQAQILAKAYKRPFALFFLPEIPRDFLPLQDFRKDAKKLTTGSIFIIREIQQKQAWISDVYSEGNDAKLPFVGRFSIKDNPIVVAQDILKILNINPSNYQSENVIKEWIDAAETNGIFVSYKLYPFEIKIRLRRVTRVCIADSYAPFVFVNSDDWNAPQLFTLVHELAHIWIAETGISNDIEPEIKNKDKYHPIEIFCNEVAANALMPKEVILKFGESIYQNFQDVFKTAKILGVSSFALLVRALNLNQIATPLYQKLKKQAESEYIAYLRKEEEKKAALKLKQKEKPGGPNPYLLRLNKNSRLFTQVVLDALRGGYVQPTQASLLLGTPANNFHKLEAQIYR